MRCKCRVQADNGDDFGDKTHRRVVRPNGEGRFYRALQQGRQAKYLEDRGTELNIMMGLCLGHDMIFNAKSKAPVTPLIVKDRKLNHKTLEVLRSEK